MINEVTGIEQTNEYIAFMEAKGYRKDGCLTYPRFEGKDLREKNRACELFESKLRMEFAAQHKKHTGVFFGMIGNGKKVHRFVVDYLELHVTHYVTSEVAQTKGVVSAWSDCGSVKWTRTGNSPLHVSGVGEDLVNCAKCAGVAKRVEALK